MLTRALSAMALVNFPKAKKMDWQPRIFETVRKTSGNFVHEHLSGFEAAAFYGGTVESWFLV